MDLIVGGGWVREREGDDDHVARVLSNWSPASISVHLCSDQGTALKMTPLVKQNRLSNPLH